MSRRLLPFLALLLAACQGTPTERPDTLVDLATVRSGPRRPMSWMEPSNSSPTILACWLGGLACAWLLASPSQPCTT
jgi:hypothetical protein